GPYPFAIGLQARQNARPSPGGDDDMVGGVLPRALRTGRLLGTRPVGACDRVRHRQPTRPSQSRLAPDHLNFVLLKQPFDASTETSRNRSGAPYDRLGVESYLVSRETIILPLTHEIEDFS